MKKSLLIISMITILSSCSSDFYQICKVASDLSSTTSGAYKYGNSILYVDLTKSFLIKNGIAYDYFLNRTVSVTSSSTLSESIGGTWVDELKRKNDKGSIVTTFVNSESIQNSIVTNLV